MVISSYSISGYSKINCHMLLMVNGGVILLMVISSYSIGGY